MRGLAGVIFFLSACGGVDLSNVCGYDITCAGGGTYRQCTTNAGTGAYFLASDETTWLCVTADNCTDARDQAINWCSTH